MNDPGLDPDTVERMLRGESAGRPALAALLAAASAPPARDPDGEEAAAAAFLEARSLPPARPHRRRISALVGLKTAVAGLAVLLAGGVAVAATGQHSDGPAKTGHSGRTGAPAERGRTTARYGPSPSPRPATSRPAPEAEPTERPSSKAKKPHPSRKPHPTENSETHTPAVKNSAGVKVDVPSTGPQKLTTTNPTETIAPDGSGSVAGVLGGL